jgi:uncharacterized membrane protein YecN with MAPEG domain
MSVRVIAAASLPLVCAAGLYIKGKLSGSSRKKSASRDAQEEAEAERETFVWGAAGVTAGGLIVPAAQFLLRPDYAGLGSAEGRLAYGARVSVFSLLPLLATHLEHGWLASSAADEDSGVAGEAREDAERVEAAREDTVHETAVFVPAQLALAASLPAEHMQLLPILTSVFVTGRVFHYFGRKMRSPRMRAFGSGVSAVSTAVAVIGSVSLLTAESVL